MLKIRLEKQAMNTSSQAERGRMRFELASGTLEVDVNTLERMKLAMLSFLRSLKPSFQHNTLKYVTILNRSWNVLPVG